MATNIARGGDRPGTWITLRTAKAGDSHDYTKSYEDQEEHEHDLRTRERVMTRLMFFSEGLHRVIQTNPVTRSEYGDSDDGMPIDNPFDARPPERSVHSSPGLRPRADLEPEDRFAHSFADTALAIRSMTGPELQVKIAETLADRWLADESFRESPETFLQEAGMLDPTGRIAKTLGAEATDDQLRAAMRGLADLFPLDADPAAPDMAANIRGRYKAVLNNPSLLGRDPGWELMQCWMAG